MTNLLVADSLDGAAAQLGSMDGSKFRCMHPECQGFSFKMQKDLRRHEKKHDPSSPLWQCGCCLNLGQSYSGSKRKDKVRDHLRNQHETLKSKDETAGIFCPENGCHALLTAASCLDEHLRQEHPGNTMVTSAQNKDGE